MAPMVVVPLRMPICSPVKCNCCPSQVPRVTYQAPQIKYSRNIITDRRSRICKSTPSPLGPMTYTDSNKKPSEKVWRSARGGLAARGTVEPKIDGFFHAGRRLVRHGNFAVLAGGGVTSVERVHYHEAIFSGGLRSFFSAGATRAMRQLLGRAVVPEFFEYGVGPAFGGGSFFDGIAVAIFAEGC